MRIRNLEFRKSMYLGEPPEHIGYDIVKWENNKYYNQQDKYIKDGDYYYDIKNPFIRLCEDIFKSKENCYTIASWNWNKNEYEFSFCLDRPLKLNNEEWEDFKRLIYYGYGKLQ